MKLSDIFPSENHKNLPFPKKCLPLEFYTKFIQYVISGAENYVAKAFKRCEEEGHLPDYFSDLEKEEQTMIFGDYSYEDDIRVQLCFLAVFFVV